MLLFYSCRFIKTLWQKYGTCHLQANSLEQPDEEDVPDSAQVTSLKDYMLRIWDELSNNQEITRYGHPEPIW